ncbi:MAG TPA: SMC-Scp complex subunit ScpB, partial [Candidatus Limnocylindrales bacterium]|nr:SMC-Scp complex subunit ScpB [Candidatus Limnocylindrales bacterium]
GDERSGDERSGDERSGDERSGDERSGDELAGDEASPEDARDAVVLSGDEAWSGGARGEAALSEESHAFSGDGGISAAGSARSRDELLSGAKRDAGALSGDWASSGDERGAIELLSGDSALSEDEEDLSWDGTASGEPGAVDSEGVISGDELGAVALLSGAAPSEGERSEGERSGDELGAVALLAGAAPSEGERFGDERFGDERFGDERFGDERVEGERVEGERFEGDGSAHGGLGEGWEPGEPGQGQLFVPAQRVAEDEPGISEADLVPALEAILMVVDEPVGEITLAQVLDVPAEQVANALIELSARYTEEGKGFDLRRAAGGWRFYTRAEYSSYVEKFVLDGQQLRLTQASLETLAVVAYKQPVTRSRISAIRGVNCDGVVRTLITRGLIEECGTEPESGAHLYRTTNLFLEKLGLDSVAQLPPLAPFLPDNLDEVAANE